MNLLKTILLISSIQMVAAFSLSQLKTKTSPSALKAWQDDPYGSYGGSSSRTRYYDSGYQRYPSNDRYGYDNYDRGYQRYPNNRYNRGYNDQYNMGYSDQYNRGYQRVPMRPGFDDDLRYSSGNYGYNNYGSSPMRNYNGPNNMDYQRYPSMDYSGYNAMSYMGLENRGYDRYPSYGYSNMGNDRYYNGRQNYLPSYYR